MTVIRVMKVKSKGLPTNVTVGASQVREYTLKVRSWENVTDRPDSAGMTADQLPEEVRDQLRDWLGEVES